ncbi:16S rRNA (guanine(966)-N(2))-methyltransferase RsmD [Lacisediminimonas sp.]|uniref:16S rRNA (guanine(966)-N(2))-methyltransferase RsmD n=1 Tax=Lacisediminimonas sp. TaxID=3060582 RepID=UPI002727D9CB|nr:16S rRNA (guanine(966)-N(2))-methyltransferase RsmD [Lacisediminimonas sp.]MDO8298638.1 16S rRNA (guanine(966)-N(2))-methyltransferase RsmD [Lacisediminimonas sp.]
MKARRSTLSSAPRQVRIIGGQWKRTPLPVVSVEGLRPTPDRVRETVFNWLNHLIDGRWQDKLVLDLFAGTGALGFEAASRGAQKVVMVETAGPALRVLEQVKDKLDAGQVSILKTDALRYVRSAAAASYDVIFLDPPYSLELLPALLPACARLLKPGGLVYAESDKAFPQHAGSWMDGWEVVRSDGAGAVCFYLLHCIKVA